MTNYQLGKKEYGLFALFFCTIAIVSCTTKGTFKNPQLNTSQTVTDARRSAKPNIILILGDDIGYEVPSYTGGESYSTPTLDKLAATGQQFTQCHAAPDCSPSRIMMMTGKYNFRNYTQWGILDTSQYTIGNLMKKAGYKTCVAGKWQFDGGDASIRKFGFDDYLVFLPFFTVDESAENAFRYKDPHLYQNAAYLPDSVTKGKYADDMFVDYISRFIDSNSKNPFFIYYPMSLCHSPFTPTPDDPEFATWDPTQHKSEKKFFPSMVAYMDKEVQKVIDKLQQAGLDKNTIVIYMGDNGTPGQVTSIFRGGTIQGGKGTSTMLGTHVPFILYSGGRTLHGAVNNSLIDFSDILFTLADIAGTNVPPRFGPYDGISFYRSVINNSPGTRTTTFCHWQPKSTSGLHRWAQTVDYKLYDTTDNSRFFHITADTLEQNPLKNSQLTPDELAIKQQLQDVINQMH